MIYIDIHETLSSYVLLYHNFLDALFLMYLLVFSVLIPKVVEPFLYNLPRRHELEFLVRHTLRHVPWLLLGLDTQLVSKPQFGQTIFVLRRVVQDQAPTSWSNQWSVWEGCHTNSLITYDAAVAKVQLPYSLDHDEPWSWFLMLIADDCSVIGPRSSKSASTTSSSWYFSITGVGWPQGFNLDTSSPRKR